MLVDSDIHEDCHLKLCSMLLPLLPCFVSKVPHVSGDVGKGPNPFQRRVIPEYQNTPDFPLRLTKMEVDSPLLVEGSSLQGPIFCFHVSESECTFSLCVLEVRPVHEK